MARTSCVFTTIILLVFLMITNLHGVEETIPWPDKIQDIDTVNGWLFDLVEKYPELLDIEVIGYSTDSRPVYALQLTDESKPASEADGTAIKKRFLLEAGTHAREVANPYYALKMVELYCMDFEEDSTIPAYNMKSLLGKAVIHVLPMTNPDGYAYAVSGKPSIRSAELLEGMLHIYEPSSHEWYKANLNGVDLNRNYPAVYYDVETKSWKDIFGMPNAQQSYIPSSKYYAGKEAASEIETRIVTDYIDDYDFRALVNYHSKGRIVLWNRWMLSEAFNSHVKDIAKAMADKAEYKLGRMDVEASGYMSDYFAMTRLKPAITVETGTYYFDEDLGSEFDRVKLLPLIAFSAELKDSYGSYRVYVDGYYVNDFKERVYAQAFAEKLGGVVVTGSGIPSNYHVRFSEAMDALVEAGIIMGDGNRLMPDKVTTRAEAIVMLARAIPLMKESTASGNWRLIYKPLPFNDVPDWAEEAVAKIYSMDLVRGISDTAFGPKLAITRNQFLTFLLRMMGYVEGEDFNIPYSGSFAVHIGLTTSEEMDSLHEKGLLREEAALLIHRAIIRRYL